MSYSTAKRAVKRLRKEGLLVLVRQGNKATGPNVYRVTGWGKGTAAPEGE